MKISGEYVFPVAREELWQALLDPEVLANTLPGCEDLKQVGENQLEGKLKMKVGPVQGLFEGRVEITELDPPNGYSLSLSGQGAPGFVNGKGRLSLEETGDGTRLRYDIDAQVGGRIAAVGQRLLDSSAKVITRQGLEGLDRQLRARAATATMLSAQETGQELPAGARPIAERLDGDGDPYRTVAMPYESPTPTPAFQPPSQAEFTRGFLAGLLKELLPKGGQWAKPEIIVLAATLILLLAVAISLRACSG